jgi:hypothetical protein
MSFGIIASSSEDNTGTGSAYADLVLTSAPLLYWRLGDVTPVTARDTSAHNRPGIYTGSPLLGETGLLASDPATSVYFAPPTNDQASIAYDSSWMNPTSFTITCLFQLDAAYIEPGLHMLASRFDQSGNWTWFIYAENGDISMYYNDPIGSSHILDPITSLRGGENYFLAAYAGPGGAELRIYNAGGLIGFASDGGANLMVSPRAFIVGGADNDNSFQYGGYLQEVAFFGSALSVPALNALATEALGIQPQWINRASGSLPRNGTLNHTLTFAAASAGSLLVAVASGAVTHTAITSGWTKQLSATLDTEVAVFTRSASGGETSLQLSHNASNFPIHYVVYEFPAGSSYVMGAKDDNGTTPPLNGLPGTPVTVYSALSIVSDNPADPDTTAIWRYNWIEDIDVMTKDNGTTNGDYFTLGYQPHFTGTDIDPGNDGYMGPVWMLTNSNGNFQTCITFAIQLP